MERETKLWSGTFFLGTFTVLSKIVVFFLLPLYTACLTPSEFGSAEIVVNTAVLLLPFVTFNAPEALFRFLAGGKDEKKVFTAALGLSLVGFLAFLAFLPLFSRVPALAPYVRLLFFYVLFSFLRNFLAQLLRGKGQFFLFGAQQFFCTVATALLEILFLRILRLGITGYLLAVVAADLLTFLILFFYISPWRFISFSVKSRQIAPAMLRYALPLMPTAALWWILSASDHYLLLHYCGDAVTGIYAAAGRICALLTAATGLFLEVFHYAAVRECEEKRALLFDSVYGFFLAVLFPAASLLILLAKPLVTHFFAPGYAFASDLIPILAPAAIFSSLASFFGSAYSVRLRTMAALFTSLAGAGLNILLNLVLVPRGGAAAAGFTTLLSYALVFFLRFRACRRSFPCDGRFRKLFFSTFCLLLTALPSVNRQLPFLFLICIAAVLPFLGEYVRFYGIVLQKIQLFFKKRLKI